MISFSHLGDPNYGRLGNQLFQIAATIAIARANKQEFVFPEWKYHSYFENTLPVGQNRNAAIYYQKSKHFYEVRIGNSDTDLRGFFSCADFFSSSREEVRYYLKPKTLIISDLKRKYEHIFSRKTCSLHIRRGDFLKYQLQYPPIEDSYYFNAFKEFDEETLFVVFSDDIEYCKSKFIGDKFVFIENEIDIIDMFLMSMCDNHILSNSTFCWWGAWLNENFAKKIIAPRQWFGPGHAINYKRLTKEITKDFITIKSNKEYNILEGGVIYLIYHIKLFFMHKLKKIIPQKIRSSLRSKL